MPLDFPTGTAGINHNPGAEHHDTVDATFPYRTMGIPKPGDKFNFTRVPQDKLYEYDTKFMELFQPYNVLTSLFRIQTASMPGTELPTKEDM